MEISQDPEEQSEMELNFKKSINTLMGLTIASERALKKITKHYINEFPSDSSTIDEQSSYYQKLQFYYSQISHAKDGFCYLYNILQYDIHQMLVSTEGAELLDRYAEELSVLEDFYNDFPDTNELIAGNLFFLFRTIKVDSLYPDRICEDHINIKDADDIEHYEI